MLTALIRERHCLLDSFACCGGDELRHNSKSDMKSRRSTWPISAEAEVRSKVRSKARRKVRAGSKGKDDGCGCGMEGGTVEWQSLGRGSSKDKGRLARMIDGLATRSVVHVRVQHALCLAVVAIVAWSEQYTIRNNNR